MAKRKPAKLAFGSEDVYIPDYSFLTKNLGLTDREIRREYTRLRNIANKRIKALSKSEFTDTRIYQLNKEGFPSIKKLTQRMMVSYLAQLASFVTAKSSSVTGLRELQKQTIETLHEHGYTWVNKSNLKEFGDFMEQMRDKNIQKMYSSETIAEVWHAVKKHGVSTDDVRANFDFWVKNRDSILHMRKIKDEERVSSDDIRNALKERNMKKVKKSRKKI